MSLQLDLGNFGLPGDTATTLGITALVRVRLPGAIVGWRLQAIGGYVRRGLGVVAVSAAALPTNLQPADSDGHVTEGLSVIGWRTVDIVRLSTSASAPG